MTDSGGSRASARPRQVTVAGVMATAACLLLVVTLFDAMAQVRSTEMRDSIEDFLGKPPGDGLGVGVSAMVDVLRAMVLFSGAVAAAGAVLGIYVLRRHRGARIGLTVAAVLLLFSATFVAGFLPILVAVATAMLWGRDSRDWFDGRAPRPRSEERLADPRSSGSPAEAMTVWRPDPEVPRRDPEPAPGSTPAPGPAVRPFGTVGEHRPPQSALEGRRPSSVTLACWLTWVSAGLIAGVFLLMVLTLLSQQDQLLAELRKNASFTDLGLSDQQVLGILWVLSAVSIVWAIAAMVLAVLAFRRFQLGRIGLAISAGLAGAVCLLAVPFGWLHAGAAFATLVLLARKETGRWYAGRDGRPPYVAPPQPTSRDGKPPVW